MNVFVTGIDLTDGKNVLLLTPEHFDQEEEIIELREVLLRNFPHCQFTVLSGGFQAVVTSHEDAHYEIEE